MVLLLRIELRIHPYHGCGIPFTYKSRKPTEVGLHLERVTGIEPVTCPWQGYVLPLAPHPHVFIYSKFSAVKVSTVACPSTSSLRTLASNTASCRACFCFFKLATTDLKPARSSAVNTLESTVSP